MLIFMYKNHGKHDQHYLIYKYTSFSCNMSCRWCLNHSITDSYSQVQRGGIFHHDRGPSGAPPPVILNLNNLIPLGCSPCLIRCGIEALVYLSCWSQWQRPPPFSQDPLKNVYAKLISWIFAKDHEFPFKGFAWNQCFYRLSMINAGFGMFGQCH